MEILKVENLTKVYGKENSKVVALDNVSFSILKGEFVAIVGASGSGKSTFLKTIYGELPACNGEPQVLEYNMREIRPGQIPALRRRLGIVFQDFQLISQRRTAAYRHCKSHSEQAGNHSCRRTDRQP